MSWNWVSLIFAAAGLLALALSAILWRRGHAPGARAFSRLLLAAAMWAWLAVAQPLAVNLPAPLFLAQLQNLAGAVVTPLWLLFALDAAEVPRARSGALRRGLWLLPAVAVLLAFTNDYHRLIWAGLASPPGAFPVVVPGPAAYFLAVYHYLLLAVGTLLLLWTLTRAPNRQPRQAALVLGSLTVLWSAIALHLAGALPVGADPTPVALALTGALFTKFLVRGPAEARLAELDPLVRSLPQAVILLSADNRILDANPAGQRLLGAAADRLVGRPLAAIWPGPAALSSLGPSPAGAPLEIELSVAGQIGRYGLHSTPLARKGQAAPATLLTVAALPDGPPPGVHASLFPAFQAAAVGMALLSLHGRWTQVNPALCALLGYSEAELLAGDVQSFTHPDDRGAALPIAGRLLDGAAGSYQVETQLRHKAGHAIWVLFSVALVRAADGAPLYLSAQIQDIREYKRVRRRNEAFARLAQRLNLVTTPKEAAYMIVDVADALLGWDAAYLDLYSEAHDTITSILSFDLVDGRRVEVRSEPINAPPGPMQRSLILGGSRLTLRAPGEPDDLPFEPFGDTSRRSESLMFVPLRHGERVMGILSIQRYASNAYTDESLNTLQALADLAASALNRIEAQAELRQMEARSRYLIEHATDLIFATDAHGRLVAFNPMVSRVTQYPAGELQGRSVLDFVHPAHVHRTRRLYQRQLIDRVASTYSEVLALARDGTEIWLGQNVQLVFENGLVAGFQVVARDVTRRKQAEEQLRHMALHDALTGLPNRLLLLDRLERSVEHARRHPQEQFAVLYLDLDRFKTINDSLGHPFGDQVLIAVAQRLSQTLRHEDTLARLGGDEFVVLLQDVRDVRGAILGAERLLQAISAPLQLGDHTLFLGTSIGIVMSGPSYDQPDAMLRDADIALYRAKALGKGRYAVFDEQLYARAAYELALEAELRHALERGEFRLVYQPIVILATGQLHGFEALLRWEHPTRGLLSPEAFLSLAEEVGLLGSIDAWALRQACRQAAAWQRRMPHGTGLIISLNLSRAQLHSDQLITQVAGALADTGLPPRCLCLEVTESAMADQDGIVARLRALHDLGVQLHVDDFGTGTSSLRVLQQVPFDALKISSVFVRALDGAAPAGEGGSAGQDSDTLVRLVFLLARELGREAVAEGIETEAQLAQLRDLGCRLGQGYLFARPLFADAAEMLLAA